VTPRARILFFSDITPRAAVILPIQGLVRKVRAEAVFTLVDGAHAPGQVPLRLEEWGMSTTATATSGCGRNHARPLVLTVQLEINY
jgi:selenocysteine lyase/cysteine desulfurase